MTATPHSSPDPLAALPLLTEAGVSVYWQALEGRTAWVADPDTRQIWLSRAIPRDSVLRYLIQALQVIDDATEPDPEASGGPALRVVHSAEAVESPAPGTPPGLRVVRDDGSTSAGSSSDG